MGKVILIEPHKVLQQAIALSLFPEHDVEVQATLAASAIGAFKGIDLLIVDAAALREGDKLSPELTGAVQGSSIPTLWIDDNESEPPPKRDKLAVLTKPIESAAFQTALADLLSSSNTRSEPKKTAGAAEPKGEKSKAAEKKAAGGRGEQPEPELIDLFEVVEEESPPSEKHKSPGKPK